MYYQLLITTPWLFQYLLSTKMMMKSNVHVFIYGTGETEILFEQKEHKRNLGMETGKCTKYLMEACRASI